MNLVIRALTLDNKPVSEVLTGSFGPHGGTIGRSDTNTIALPDPERHISRLQAEVIVEGEQYLIRNAGAANPILLNGRTLAPGERAALTDRDELQIGGYVLGVHLDGIAGRPVAEGRPADARTVITGSAGEYRTDPPPMTAGRKRGESQRRPAPATNAGNPFADLLAPTPASGPSADPFAFLAAPGVGSQPPAAPLVGQGGAAVAKLPDDFDPFADLMAAPREVLASPAGTPSSDLLGSIGASSGHAPGIDEAFGLSAAGAGGADPLAGFMSPSAAAGVAADIGTDPLAMFSADAGRGARSVDQPAAFNHTAELAGAYAPPRVLSDSADAPKTPVRAAAPLSEPRPSTSVRPAARGNPLWSAFCEGAEIRLELPQGLTPEQMKIIGQVLREAVDGTLRLMAIRATTKNELRAQMTTIKSRNNNPLKFSPTAPQAVEQLLQPPLRGFTAGPVAMQDAMHDLVGHSIGTMAGMRAALAGVLGRFQPEALQAKLAGKSVLDSLLPMNRKARLWDLYLQHFESIRGEAQDDFHTLFGKAFVEAYEDQLDRLSNEKVK